MEGTHTRQSASTQAHDSSSCRRPPVVLIHSLDRASNGWKRRKRSGMPPSEAQVVEAIEQWLAGRSQREIARALGQLTPNPFSPKPRT